MLKHFHMNWEKLTSDPYMINLVQGYQVPFSSKPFRNFVRRMVQINQEEVLLADQEIQEMLRKGEIRKV